MCTFCVSFVIHRQFLFRMQHGLPFYVWTLNERFTLEELPSFDDVPEDENYIPRLYRVEKRRREDSSIISGGKSVMPVQHSRSIRARFHRYPVDVADVPEQMTQRVREVVNKEFVVTWCGQNSVDWTVIPQLRMNQTVCV